MRLLHDLPFLEHHESVIADLVPQNILGVVRVNQLLVRLLHYDIVVHVAVIHERRQNLLVVVVHVRALHLTRLEFIHVIVLLCILQGGKLLLVAAQTFQRSI